jgi:predicted RNA-binding protein associated with RNAse of E/G family
MWLSRTHPQRPDVMIQAPERYAACEGRQIEQTCATLAALEAGALETIDLDDLMAEDLAAGEITQEDLEEAYARCGVIS